MALYDDGERQFILRLPPAMADKMRDMITRSQFDGFSFYVLPENTQADTTPSTIHDKFPSERKFEVSMPGFEKKLGTMIDIPTTIESYKTGAGNMYYKSADIHQMLVVHETAREAASQMKAGIHAGSGLTPPTKDIRRRRIIRHPRLPVDDVADLDETFYAMLDKVETSRTVVDLIELDESLFSADSATASFHHTPQPNHNRHRTAVTPPMFTAPNTTSTSMVWPAMDTADDDNDLLRLLDPETDMNVKDSSTLALDENYD